MKKHIVNVGDMPDTDIRKGSKAPTQDTIYEFIKIHPHCTRRDIYSLPFKEGDIRRALILMLKSRKLKETFTIQ